jgi:hypothetical protein
VRGAIAIILATLGLPMVVFTTAFVTPAEKALPSNDPCSHIFFPNMWGGTDDGNQVRDPTMPNIRCFLTPLDFCPRTRAPSLSEADPRSSSARHRR